MLPVWCQHRHFPCGDSCTSWTGAWMCLPSCLSVPMTFRVQIIGYNVFVCFSVWLHLLSVCLTGGIAREWNYVCGFGKVWKCVCALKHVFFFHRTILKWNTNLIVKLFSHHTVNEKLLYNRTMHSAATSFLFKSSSSGFPPLYLNIYPPISVHSSTLMFSNVCMHLPFSGPFVTERGVMILNQCTLWA